jgi:hypothetical protein
MDKKKLIQIGVLTSLMMSGQTLKKETVEMVLPKKVQKPVIHKGHKLFVIEGVEYYALNYKNALKKANKNK